jgi:uncharacterized protein YbaR (Trm112 family)
MIDILACPLDKNYPLELIELQIKEFENRTIRDDNVLKSDKNKNIKKNNHLNHQYNDINSKEELKDKVIIIIEGILFCKKCLRFYPIVDEIPIMLPDELREKEKDIEFLNKWKNNIPEYILKNANPWHL